MTRGPHYPRHRDLVVSSWMPGDDDEREVIVHARWTAREKADTYSPGYPEQMEITAAYQDGEDIWPARCEDREAESFWIEAAWGALESIREACDDEGVR